MLASTGLLNGKNCSTHWSAADAFKNLFPKVNLKPDNLITDEQGIYTNGGGYSFLNLAIYLVEKYYGRQAAIYCSKLLNSLKGNQDGFFITPLNQTLIAIMETRERHLNFLSRPRGGEGRRGIEIGFKAVLHSKGIPSDQPVITGEVLP